MLSAPLRSAPLLHLTSPTLSLCTSLLAQRWEACPGSRREIENLIAGRISTRVSSEQPGHGCCDSWPCMCWDQRTRAVSAALAGRP